MSGRHCIAALLLAAALGGCAELTAQAPLFAPADQIGPPPLTEGVWITVNDTCPAYYARRRTGRFPRDCYPIEIRRLDDGAWQIWFRADLTANPTAADRRDAEDHGPMRAIIAPAIEHPSPDAYSPLYLLEINPGAGDGPVTYAVVAPIGDEAPATSALVIGSISCLDILRDGPIEGVTEQYTAPEQPAAEPGAPPPEVREQRPPTLSGCTASTQAAVREAARRAVIENLREMTQTRFVYVRPH